MAITDDETDKKIDSLLLDYGNKVVNSWRSHDEFKLYSAEEHADRCNNKIRPQTAAQLSALLQAARVDELKALPVTEDDMGWAVDPEVIEARITTLLRLLEKEGK